LQILLLSAVGSNSPQRIHKCSYGDLESRNVSVPTGGRKQIPLPKHCRLEENQAANEIQKLSQPGGYKFIKFDAWFLYEKQISEKMKFSNS
jgi:hypothetical protein